MSTDPLAPLARAAAALCPLAIVACSARGPAPQPPLSTTSPPALAAPATAASPSPAHWSYAGATGPDAWGALEPSFSTCRTGASQSPIDLPAAPSLLPAAPRLAFAYAPAPLRVFNNGHTVQVDLAGAGSRLRVDDENYELLQFHFHSPSEHTIGGRRSDLEVHFVHRRADGALAVVALLADRGAPEPALAPVFAHLPREVRAGPAPVEGATVDPRPLFAAAPAYDAYTGSLTAPPCTEGVRWFVVTTPVHLAAEQIAAFRDVTAGDSARPTRPLGDRPLTRSAP